MSNVKSFLTQHKVSTKIFDPNATSKTAAEWVDMSVFQAILVQFLRITGTSDITFEIAVATSNAGANAAVLKSSTLAAGQPNAAGDYVFLEAFAEEIAAKSATDGKNYQYASAYISFVTGTDDGYVTTTRFNPRFAYDALTSDHIST